MNTHSAEGAPACRLWRAGTLTYTFAGIVALFFLLLAGDFVWSLRERSVGVITQLLLKQHGASDFLVGLYLVALPGILGLLVGPVISYRSDRHRGRFGRRIPYLFMTTPFILVGLLGLGVTPQLDLLTAQSDLTAAQLEYNRAQYNCIIAAVGEEQISSLIIGGPYLQPFITAAIGLIPNCAASVIITDTYINNLMTFGSCVAGLCSNAGLGFVVLLKNSKKLKRNIALIAATYLISAVVGIVINSIAILAA